MNTNGLGSQLKPGSRAIACSIIFLMSMTILYQLYDADYPSVDYSTTTFIIKNYGDLDINQEDVAKGYIVWNPVCRIPDISPYHESIKPYIFKWKPLICSKLKPLTVIAFNSTSRRHTLKVDSHAFSNYSTNMAQFRCCYSRVSREYLSQRRNDKDDDRYNVSDAVCFKKRIELPVGTECVYVTCASKNKIIYKTIHLMVADKQLPPPPPKLPPASTAENETKPVATKYSVFLFGIDSISRLNFIRTLPKTREYIEQRGWLPLEGYTKIADNTFPNLIAILTGMTVDQLRAKCYQTNKHKLDDCPIVWKNFSENSYVTAYSEDMVSIGSFNYHKYGFLNSPTDYYSRPGLLAGSKYLKIKHNGGMDYCMGQQPQIEYLFQFNTEFVQRFHDRPYFNLFWSNSYSHNEMNMPSVMDERVRSFLADIHDYLNTTVVVFFSDHGMRFGKARETYVGWLEERMPFIYFYLPPSFRAAHPDRYDSLRANKNRLTTPYDLHATLQHLLYGRVAQPPAGCPLCDSLLRPAAANRSCDDAAVTSHWCTCSTADAAETAVADPKIVTAAHLAINAMNAFLRRHADQVAAGHRCATLSLSRVVSVRGKVRGGTLALFAPRREYVIVFETDPSKGVFEITASSDGGAGAEAGENVDEISRINMYGKQSACVKASGSMRLFCFCVKK